MFAVAAIAVATLALAPAAGTAQQEWGLALGGGGARGIAHGGVVVGLERRGYDPGIVVGTSMGAIVGALYAAGFSPEAIWDVLEAEDWPELFVPTPVAVGPDRERRHPIVRFGLTGEPPETIWGLVPDWRINRRLARFFFDPNARARGDFDRLPRRFRAVAADLETGDAVTLGSGDLALAVRASIAVPGAFSPVYWGDRVLVDGGIAAYLPVAEARSLGADRVIASDVIRPPPMLGGDDPVDDAIDAGTRAFRLLLLNTIPDDERPDELVLPEIPPEISSAAFPREPLPLLRAGLEGALDDLPPAEDESREGVGTGAQPPREPPTSFDELRVETTDSALSTLVRAAFEDAAPGPYRPDAVLDAIDDLYGTGFFQGVWPRVEVDDDDDDATARLVVRADPQPPTTASGAAGYGNDRGFRGWAAVTHRFAVGLPGELGFAASADAIERWIAPSLRLASRRAPPLVWTASAHYRQHDARLVADGDVIGEIEVERFGGLAGAEYRDVARGWTATAAVRAEHIDVGALGGGGESGISFGPMLRLVDPTPFARVVGMMPRVEADVRFGDVDYHRFRLGGSVTREYGRLRAAAVGDLVVTGGGAPIDVLPALGDEHIMPGYRWHEARGRARIVGGLDVAHPVGFGAFARLRLRAGAAPDDVALDPLIDDADEWALGAGLDLVWATPFGSAVVGVGANTRDRWRVEVDIGPEF